MLKEEILFMPTAEAMQAFGNQIAEFIPEGCHLYLYGNLGAGKTTLVRSILRGLGYEGKVKSPTYTIVEPYHLHEKQLYHFDLYRLVAADELIQIGIEEYFNETAICLVEWPENGMPILPTPDIAFYITIKDSGRAFKVVAHTEKGNQLLNKMVALKS